MRKTLHLLIVLLLISGLSCKKDKINKEDNDHTFLFSNQMKFSGDIADSSLLWKYGVFEFQRGSGSINVATTEPSLKYLTFWLTSNDDLTTRFEINTAKYNSNTNALFSDVLAPGRKEFGIETEKFEMKLTLNNLNYTTDGDQTGSQLEILKTEKTKDEFGRDMALVWFKTNCKFYTADKKFAFDLTNGYILAGFQYNL